MSMISWMLMVHDITAYWVKKNLPPVQQRWFCLWLGFPYRGTNKSIFFRSKEHYGLQLKEMSMWHKRNRLIKRHILSKSKDPKVRAIHECVSSEQ